MIPLTVLVFTFLILLLVNKVAYRSQWSNAMIGRVSLAVMLLFTGMTHFTRTGMMVMMLPDFLPEKELIVYATGVIEILAVPGLAIRRWSRRTSIFLIVFFLLILPANIIGIWREVNFTDFGLGRSYIYLRIPIQLLFIIWAWWFGIRKNK